MGQYLKVNNMAPNKNPNGGCYAHTQTSNASNFCLSLNSTKFIRMFMEQYYLKRNDMPPIKNHIGGYYAHAQISNASWDSSLRGNSLASQKIIMADRYKALQVSNACNSCLS